MWTLDLSPSGDVIGIGGTDTSTTLHVEVVFFNVSSGNPIS